MEAITLSLVAAWAGLAVFAGFLLTAAAGDVRRFIIPNTLNLAMAAAFLLLALPMGMSLVQLGWHLLAALAVLAVAIGLFAAGVWGGGDAKMMGAASIWLGPAALGSFVFWTALSGGVLVLALLAGRGVARHAGLPKGPRWLRQLLRRRAGVPYGVALAGGALLAAPLAPWFPAATALVR